MTAGPAPGRAASPSGGGADRGEDPGADDGADPEDDDVERAEHTPQPVIGVGCLAHELVDAFRAEQALPEAHGPAIYHTFRGSRTLDGSKAVPHPGRMREVLVEEHSAGRVLLIQLNRPDRSNAVNGALIAALGRAVDGVAAAPAVRAVVLTGAGRTFCAGGDLDYFAAEAAADPLTPPATAMAGILDRIAGSDRVWIAALNGAAIGGGLELALACHLRVASEGASVSMRHLTLGLSPAWGGGDRLFDAVGVAAGLWLLLTGTTVDAAESLRLGLVQRVFGDDTFLADALALAGDIAGRPREALAGVLALAAAKRSGAERHAFRAAEQALFTERWRSPEFQGRLAEHRARPRS